MSNKEYEVGYGKPPVETRFRKGQSGNPRGRPKGSRNKSKPRGGWILELEPQKLESIILDEAYRDVTVRENGYATEMPMVRAVVRAMGVNALKGNRPAQAGFTELVARLEKENYDSRGELYRQLIEQQVEGREVIRSHLEAGREPPDILPHPDDIRIDTRNQRVVVEGPFDEEQKRALERLMELRDECADSVSVFASKHRRAKKEDEKAHLLKIWHTDQKLFDRVNDRLPPRYRTVLKSRSYAEGASREGEFANREWSR